MGNRRFVLVAVDYFMKWAEAEVLANIRDVDIKRFVWRNIITRFGVPESLVSDNGLQFDCKTFREFCNNLGIRNRYSTLAYSQSNGQAEATNKAIVSGLKKRLESAKEAVIPAEVNLCSARVAGFASDENEKLMSKQLNLLEEHQEAAINRLAEYQQKLTWKYNRNVRKREFATGDLVLRKVVGNT
ncbi:uncharacterized protein LOC142640130 [Castanea sativa]|uniref:uncharacterized protein LOC142640130 n=1 Tax=Castanea sativa TaxID=21020 RepID=UPI003F64C4FF